MHFLYVASTSTRHACYHHPPTPRLASATTHTPLFWTSTHTRNLEQTRNPFVLRPLLDLRFVCLLFCGFSVLMASRPFSWNTTQWFACFDVNTRSKSASSSLLLALPSALVEMSSYYE